MNRLPTRSSSQRRCQSARRIALRARGAAFAAAVLSIGALTACSAPDPSDTAASLAADLTAGALTTVPVSQAPDLTEMLGDLADFEHTVTAPSWQAEEDAATIQLHWAWDIAGHEWSYTSEARAVREDDEWIVQWSPEIVHPEARESSAFDLTRTQGERGEILSDTSGALVSERPVYHIGIDKTLVTEAEDQRAAALELAVALDFDDAEGYADRVEAAGERAFILAITVRQSEAAEWGVDDLRTIEGVNVVSASAFLAPSSTFARPILGRVGEATAEIIETSEGRVAAGDTVGLSGLQLLYDEQLTGKPGIVLDLVTGDDRHTVFEAPPDDGAPLTVTLNQYRQESAERVLGDAEGVAALVAIQPSNGHVVAAATTDSWNASSLGQYAPGSTFKVVTALALLRAGYTPDSQLECAPTATVDGRQFTNYPGYAHTGTITLRDALAYSCNTAFIALSEEISAGDMAGAALSLGLGQPGPWAFEYFPGDVPGDAAGTSHAAALIGQGGVLASPMAMATVAASVAAGHTVTPTLILDEVPALSEETGPLTDEEAAALAEMMAAVVESGTGGILRDLPGSHAKTGTAQFGDADPPETNAWMIAFRDDLAVAVFVEGGGAGASTAGPIMEAFLSGEAEVEDG